MLSVHFSAHQPATALQPGCLSSSATSTSKSRRTTLSRPTSTALTAERFGFRQAAGLEEAACIARCRLQASCFHGLSRSRGRFRHGRMCKVQDGASTSGVLNEITAISRIAFVRVPVFVCINRTPPRQYMIFRRAANSMSWARAIDTRHTPQNEEDCDQENTPAAVTRRIRTRQITVAAAAAETRTKNDKNIFNTSTAPTTIA